MTPAIAAHLDVSEYSMSIPSSVTTDPEMLSAAAYELAGVGAAMAAANSGASGPTTGVVPAAADQVSALTAAHFAAHAGHYQAVASAAGTIHALLVSTLQANASSYAITEAANTVAAG
jgi:PE family